MTSLKKLLSSARLDLEALSELPDLSIKGLECDSRKVEKDFLFVAIRGAKQDGTQFIDEAIRKGAAAIVTDEAAARSFAHTKPIPFLVVPECRDALAVLANAYYGHPAQSLKVIGITGTNGKTTCSYLIEHLLQKEKKNVGVIGTVNYRYGSREIPAVETTPGPLKIQKILSEMLGERCEYAAMEVSSHALDQKRVAGFKFEAALFTNLTQDHLDYHKTLEAYFECKAALFLGLSSDKTSVLNADDARVASLAKRVRSKVLTYGVHTEADLRATELFLSQDGSRFNLSWKGQMIPVRSALAGLHNVYNILGALGVVHALGFSVERACGNLASFEGVPGRLEAVRAGQDFSVFVDFAHTPDGLENVLRSLRSFKKGKLIVVFGCGGDRDRTKRPKMGRIASELADTIYITSDNPRSEDPKAIAQEVRSGVASGFKEAVIVVDRKKAIRQALLAARSGDIVLLAGKGHERTQIIGSQALPFSDKEEAERVLNGR